MKKVIRLTEGDLHRIVRKSVNRILNEIGDTSKGKYMLGRLAARKALNNDFDGYDEIENRYVDNMDDVEPFYNGSMDYTFYTDPKNKFWDVDKQKYLYGNEDLEKQHASDLMNFKHNKWDKINLK